MGLFYRPEQSVAADFIPLYANGRYHLFYLRDWRNEAAHGRGTPWYHVVTDDFVTFEDWGEAIPRGPEGSQDLWVFTGCAIEYDGAFQIFYTGHNGDFAGSDRPQQAILRATSPDLRTWTKDATFRLDPPAGYERDDWRDPFVYYDESAGIYGMLLAARTTTGPVRNRGCTALLTSPDLDNWTVSEPFWAPDLYFTHECPDLFRIGEFWYLVYSTFSERMVTHYRISRSLDGPWENPNAIMAAEGGDTFDGRAYYAAKTAGDGKRRFVFGWLPTRDGDKDDGGYQWGGNLVVHEIEQQRSGALTVRPPDAVVAQFTTPVPTALRPILGEWTQYDDNLAADGTSGHAVASFGDLPPVCMIDVAITLEYTASGFGVNLRADAGLDNYYQLRVEPAMNRVVFDRWPRPGDQPFSIERPIVLEFEKPVRLRLLIDNDCLVAYVNDRVALSSRMYDHVTGEWGIFITEGYARITDVKLSTRPKDTETS